jgi:hypothetical protein
MRVLIATMLAVFLTCGSAFALYDNENTNTANGGSASSSATATGGSSSVGNGVNNFSPSSDARATIERGAVDIDNHNSNVNANSNSNRNENRNTNTQGQLQGQLQGQGQKQTAVGKVTTDVKVEGDTIKSYAIAFPSVSSAEGTSSGQATYLFGSLGKSNTELYKKLIPQIQTILAIPDDIMSQAEKKTIIDTLVKKMTDANRTQRFLGILWEDNSKSLLNVMGLLTWDSFWAEGQKPLQSKVDAGLVEAPVKTKTTDKGVTGNAGYVNQ